MKGFLKCLGRIKRKSKSSKQKTEIIESQVQQDTGHQKNHTNIREFSWEEIERSTGGFSSSRVIGSGGFSSVYLADIHHHPAVAAVKIIYGSRVFEEELKIMRQLHHGNIVELIGYSRNEGDDQLGALVLEYISNGTLQDKLLASEGGQVISWSKRMAIAYQLAEALEYLHEKCGSSLPVVHGDIKASNVLLDNNLDCRLCDLGSAKMGFSAAVMATDRGLNKKIMMGSPGYTDPHYLRTGIPSKKNDIYGFGVILLQLLTGAQPFCPRTGQLLSHIQNIIAHSQDDDDGDTTEHINAADHLVDPRLAGHFDRQEAAATIGLSARCLSHPPSLRPCASQILETILSNCNTTPISSLSLSSKR